MDTRVINCHISTVLSIALSKVYAQCKYRTRGILHPGARCIWAIQYLDGDEVSLVRGGYGEGGSGNGVRGSGLR